MKDKRFGPPNRNCGQSFTFNLDALSNQKILKGIYVINTHYILGKILLPKLFWPAVRKKCSSDGEKLLKFEAEGREFAKFLTFLTSDLLWEKIVLVIEENF